VKIPEIIEGQAFWVARCVARWCLAGRLRE
jgi:hypothetical protein